LSIDSIISLEADYNNAHQFPSCLRELLFLAGGDCYVLDYGIYDTQDEMQTAARKWLLEYKRHINDPFYVIDVYNGTDQFLFVYLNEGREDPTVYEAVLSDSPNDRPWIHSLGKTLSEYIDHNVLKILSSQNPF